MSGWVDSHCHLHMAAEDPAIVLRRAVEAGVDWIVCPGTDTSSSLAARDLAAAHPDRIVWSAGLHPHEAERWPAERDAIAELAAGASAVGECGLDFYRNLASREAQLSAFRDQLALAADLDKPVIVHCRDAFAEVHEEIERAGVAERTVLHCWSGGPRWARRFRDLGVTFSLAGPITFETGDTVRRGAAEAPPDRTMVETDTPYLTPPPNRRDPNEPANVVAVGEALADVWGMEVDRVRELTTATAARVFGR
ncbi:MAG: TatD family hydrolase [Acidimicrobiia bacterium]|nr:TatD family hydrolase [Acidimicrobiia bacterium]